MVLIIKNILFQIKESKKNKWFQLIKKIGALPWTNLIMGDPSHHLLGMPIEVNFFIGNKFAAIKDFHKRFYYIIRLRYTMYFFDWLG